MVLKHALVAILSLGVRPLSLGDALQTIPLVQIQEGPLAALNFPFKFLEIELPGFIEIGLLVDFALLENGACLLL